MPSQVLTGTVVLRARERGTGWDPSGGISDLCEVVGGARGLGRVVGWNWHFGLLCLFGFALFGGLIGLIG